MNDTDVLADGELSPRNVTSEYLKTKVKPKEIVIIIFMMLLWLFSIMRYCFQYPFREHETVIEVDKWSIKK